jgi:tRNA(adenine34) deaminase
MEGQMKSDVETDLEYMQRALDEARASAARGEVPVGAVVVDPDGKVLACAGNSPIGLTDPVAHAEMLALREAARAAGNYRLTGCTIYVTLEPCVMCAGAMVHARIKRIVYGADDPKGGGIVSCYRIGTDGQLNHELEIVGGVMAREASELLRNFFKERRKSVAAGVEE